MDMIKKYKTNTVEVISDCSELNYTFRKKSWVYSVILCIS